MSQFNEADFSESITDVSKAALARLDAIHGGMLEGMLEDDRYWCEIEEIIENGMLRQTRFNTVAYTETFDAIDPDITRNDMPPSYVRSILSGMALTLADIALSRAPREVSRVSPSKESVEQLIDVTWLLSYDERSTHSRFPVYTTELGRHGLTSVLLTYDTSKDAWSVGYESRRLTEALKILPDDPLDPSISIIDETD